MNADIGQFVHGVWLPAGETHLVEHMTGKDKRVVNGRITYQLRKIESALRHCKRRGLALDIGAHVGLWTQHLAPAFERVEAYEPVPVLADLFERNVQAANVRLNRLALGEHAGTVTMQVPVETTGNAHVACPGRHPGTRGVAHPERVAEYPGIQCWRVDDLDLHGVDFIKIDVEGYERHVLVGGEKLIRRDRPVIVVEQKGNDAAYGEEKNAAVHLLRTWGMKDLECISGDWIMGW